MSIQNQRQWENTRAKLLQLEAQYTRAQNRSADEPYIRKLTLQSLMKMINQLKEEIAHYQAHVASSLR
jgi:uncharacterized protein involved in exopolysaccharide biosynthesis